MSGRRRIASVAAVALAFLGLAIALGLRHYRQGDVRGSASVEFVPADVPPPRPPPPRDAEQVGAPWPTYGFDARRLRTVLGVGLRPPFRRLWTFHGQALLEFPPAVAYGRLFLPTFDGRFYAIDAKTGKALWRYDSGRCSWASPAVAGGLVFATFLSRGPHCEGDTFRAEGEVVAFSARTGKVRWRRHVGVTESSPLVAGGLVYVGDWTGRVVALDAHTGRTWWSARTGGEVKGSAALAHGRLVIGSYDGRVYAFDARSGRLLWRASSERRLGGRGRFYSTPALAYGRVFIGSTDGRVYAFGLASGRLLWAHGTGGYVYSSPAVSQGSVLVGSYDGSFYSLDAVTGDVRWRFRANGRISGSATVLGGLVYFSTLSERTYALDVRTGRLVWSFPDGKYSPVVTDARRVYLVGYGRLYALAPRRRA